MKIKSLIPVIALTLILTSCASIMGQKSTTEKILVEIGADKEDIFSAIKKLLPENGFVIRGIDEKEGLLTTEYKRIEFSPFIKIIAPIVAARYYEIALVMQIVEKEKSSDLFIEVKGRVVYTDKIEKFSGKKGDEFYKLALDLANKIKEEATSKKQ